MLPGPTISLPARQLFALPDASAARILCTAGCLWITVDHDLRDVILRPGDSFEGEDARRALLYATEPSTFTLLAQPQRSERRRLSKNSSDWSRSPIVWAATRAASSD
ncbi:MAG TPA: DUF2917 domain-containing protein [Ramlibacter sp.]|uniref:DUF2917 domain-containing protein n=1 Tax=Ramlibacter sp. TaxID=1917967 RepID=UPI002ED2C221